jgi:hypothetical protein
MKRKKPEAENRGAQADAYACGVALADGLL